MRSAGTIPNSYKRAWLPGHSVAVADLLLFGAVSIILKGSEEAGRLLPIVLLARMVIWCFSGCKAEIIASGYGLSCDMSVAGRQNMGITQCCSMHFTSFPVYNLERA